MRKDWIDLEDLSRELNERIVADSQKSVFLSYSRSDSDIADHVSLELSRFGLVTWLDRIELGQNEDLHSDLEAQLKSGIEKADCCFVLLSKESVTRPWVQWEYHEAIRQRQFRSSLIIIHAVIDNCEVPADLGHTHTVDLRNGLQSAIVEIVSHFGIVLQQRRKEGVSSSRPHHSFGGPNSAIGAAAHSQGLMLYNRGDLPGAIKTFDAAIAADETFFDALYCSAVARYDLAMRHRGESEFSVLIEQVIDRYEQLLAVRPENVAAMVNAATAYRVSKTFSNPKREKELLLRALVLAPDDSPVWLTLGHYYANIGGLGAIGDAVESNRLGISIKVNISHLTAAKYCFEKAEELSRNQGGDFEEARKQAEFMEVLIRDATK